MAASVVSGDLAMAVSPLPPPPSPPNSPAFEGSKPVLGRFASRAIGTTWQAPGFYLRGRPPLNPDSNSPLRG